MAGIRISHRPRTIALCKALAFVAAFSSATDALENGLARTPPMAWNGFMSYGGENADERIIRSIARTLASSGLRDAGWNYIEIDGGWKENDCIRTRTGGLYVSPRQFPSGMKALCDYVHGLGIKLGFYTVPGWAVPDGGVVSDCPYAVPNRAQGYYEADADTLVVWGIDYLKIDMADMSGAIRLCKAVTEKSLKAGKPILIQLHEESERPVVPWNGLQVVVRDICNTFRVTQDNEPSWSSQLETINSVAGNTYNARYAGPGAWCEGGGMGCFTFYGDAGTRLTATENRSNFSLVSVATYPLEITMDTTAIKAPEVATMLTNSEIIAVHQDSLGLQGRVIKRANGTQIWWKPLRDGSRAVALFNGGSQTASSIHITWSEVLLESGAATVRDLWKHEDLGSFIDTFRISNVPAHACEVFKISGKPKAWQTTWNLHTDRPSAEEAFRKYWQASWGPFTWNTQTPVGSTSRNPHLVNTDNALTGWNAGPMVLSIDGRIIGRATRQGTTHPLARGVVLIVGDGRTGPTALRPMASIVR